jgi:hypothetical protein
MNQPKPPEQPRSGGQSYQIELSEKEAEGIYANVAFITHSASEVVIDFARVLPGAPKGRVHARIVMTPYNAKALLVALEDNLKRFEAQFGVIKLASQPENKSIGF